MILYLVDEPNKTLLELEVWVKTDGENSIIELTSTVDIPNYSEFLLKNIDKKLKIIHDFDNLNNLRKWLWERYFIKGINNVSQIDDVIAKLRVTLKKVANDYKLTLSENYE